MSFVEKQITNLEKISKERKNEATRSILNQSRKQRMLNEVTDNKYAYDLHREKNYDGLGSETCFEYSSVIRSTDKEVCNMVSKQCRVSNLILQLVQSTTADYTEVKETYHNISYPYESDDEKRDDPEKSSYEEKERVSVSEVPAFHNMTDQSRSLDASSPVMEESFTKDNESGNDMEKRQFSTNSEIFTSDNVTDQSRSLYASSPVVEESVTEDNESGNDMEEKQSSANSDNVTDQSRSLDASSPVVEENFTEDIESVNDMEERQSSANSEVFKRGAIIEPPEAVTLPSSDIKEKADENMKEQYDDKKGQNYPAGMMSATEMAFKSAESLNKSAMSVGSTVSLMSKASLQTCVEFMSQPLNEETDKPFNVSICPTSSKRKTEVKIQPTILPLPVETINTFSTDTLSCDNSPFPSDEVMMKLNLYPSSDMNESANKFFSWRNQRVENEDANIEKAVDPVKLDNILKKMPHSMDNRLIAILETKNKCKKGRKNKLPIRRGYLSKRQKIARHRKIQKLKKFDSSKIFRREHKQSRYNDAVPQPSYLINKACGDLSKRQCGWQNGPPDGKRILPGGGYIQLRSCQWSCRKFMNGNSQSNGSGSNNGTSRGQKSKRGGSGGDTGRGHGNRNHGNGDNNDDGDNGERKRYPIKPNIIEEEEEEEEKSDDENNCYVESTEDDAFSPPRPPENGKSLEPKIINHSELKVAAARSSQRQIDTVHSSFTVEQMCYILGLVSLRPLSNVFDGTAHALNLCFSRIIHQLQFATLDIFYVTECPTCHILEGLFRHLANSDHTDIQCVLCRQICTLILHHTELCISCIPPQTHRTNTDLCFKLCQTADWDVRKLKNDHDIIRMIFKYCSNILKTPPNDNSPLQLEDLDERAVPLPTFSPSEHGSVHVSQNALVLGAVSANANGNNVTGNVGKKCSASNSAAQEIRSTAGHTPLTRKLSNQRPPLDIPPSIMEETLPSSNDKHLNRDFPPDRNANQLAMMLQCTESQVQSNGSRMRNEATGYATSMPEGTVHDVTQFHSFVDQPMGIKGIGEVTFADNERLCLVARYWHEKKLECERTKKQPCQLREEGVILERYRKSFSILGTRYQKDSQWKQLTTLGYGMHGRCFLTMDLETKHKFCIKKIDLLHYEANELCLWADLDCPYIVKLYGAIRHGYTVYILLEFIDGGDLAAVIEQQRITGQRLSHWTAINLFQQLLRALDYLHSQKNILHEDIKAENILLRGSSPQIMLTDFGISRRLQGEVEMKNKSPAGTATHFSPEKAASMGHGFPADVWAAVCVLVYMMSGKLPWYQYLKGAGCLNYIIYMRPPPMEDLPANIQEAVRDLIVRGFVKEPENRPSSSELLQHQAFQILYGETPESFYSTLTGLNSVGGGRAKVSIKDDTRSVQSADSDRVLYSLSIAPEGSGPHLPVKVDDVLEPGDSGVPPAVVMSSGNPPGPPTLDQNDFSQNVKDVRENESTHLQVFSEQNKSLLSVHSPGLDMIPKLEDLYPSYISDTYNPGHSFRESSIQNSNLEVYKPNPPEPADIPNLSIFDGSLDIMSSGGKRTPLPDFSLKPYLYLTDQDTWPGDLSHLTIDNPSSLDESYSNERPQSVSPRENRGVLDDQILHASSVVKISQETIVTKEVQMTQGALTKRSNASNHQNFKSKKPHHLTLNVSGAVQLPAEGKREKLSTNTASSNPASSTSSYSSGHGTHSGSLDIRAQQDKVYKDMISSHSSESEIFRSIGDVSEDNDSDPDEENGAHNSNDNDVVSNRPTDETPLEGQKVSFVSEDNKVLFSVRFLSTPVILQSHISEIKKKICDHGYHHFELRHKDNNIISYSSYLEWDCDRLKIMSLSVSQEELCSCAGCHNL